MTLIRKKSILKNSTSTPVVYSDGTYLAASTAANAQWNFTPGSSTGATMSSFDKIMQMAAQYRRANKVDAPVSPTVHQDDLHSEMVPTFAPRRGSESLEVADVASDADLETLKKKDAFMYYSLPGARNASLTAQEFNVTGLRRNATIGAGLKLQVKTDTIVSNARNPRFDLKISNRGTSSETDSAKMPRATSDSILQVKRQTRISCEEHFGVLLEGIMELDILSPRPSACLSCDGSVGVFMLDDDKKEDYDEEDTFYESIARIHGVLPSNVDL